MYYIYVCIILIYIYIHYYTIYFHVLFLLLSSWFLEYTKKSHVVYHTIIHIYTHTIVIIHVINHDPTPWFLEDQGRRLTPLRPMVSPPAMDPPPYCVENDVMYEPIDMIHGAKRCARFLWMEMDGDGQNGWRFLHDISFVCFVFSWCYIARNIWENHCELVVEIFRKTVKVIEVDGRISGE